MTHARTASLSAFWSSSAMAARAWGAAVRNAIFFHSPTRKNKDRVMRNKPSVKSEDLSLLSILAFWPMAMANALLEEGTELYAKNLKFVEEEIKIHGQLRPTLATPNRVRLDLRAMVLRDYGKPGGIPTLVDAPHAGHTATIADYHKGQSLVETLLANGVGHLR
jgi:hypothetical protein